MLNSIGHNHLTLLSAYQQNSHLRRDDVPNKNQSLHWNLIPTWITQVRNTISFKLFQLYKKYKNNVLLIQKSKKAGWALPCNYSLIYSKLNTTAAKKPKC